MERLKQIPGLSNVIAIIDRYPRISAWVVLSVGIIAILIYEARDVGLTTTNWIALIVASIVVSGLCIWIVSWEDQDEQVAAATDKAIKVLSDAPASSESASDGQKV